MEADFWHRRWHKNEIGFHEKDGSHLLKTYIEKLALPPGARVFVPLCGKTRDIAWLLSKGFNVVGIELNKLAVDQLFEELKVQPEYSKVEEFEHRRAVFSNGLSLDVFVGDFFTFNRAIMGKIDAVFDRAALVAFPEEMRKQYVAHLLSISDKCKQLLVCFEYAKDLLQGPPHSVDSTEVNKHYGQQMSILQLHKGKIEGGFRGQSEVFDSAYFLEAR
jgi:thiopurine S-methyltransferase